MGMILICSRAPLSVQGVSFVTGTEAHRPLLEPLANQCGARFVATPAAHTFAHLDPPPSSEAESLSASDRGNNRSEARTLHYVTCGGSCDRWRVGCRGWICIPHSLHEWHHGAAQGSSAHPPWPGSTSMNPMCC